MRGMNPHVLLSPRSRPPSAVKGTAHSIRVAATVRSATGGHVQRRRARGCAHEQVQPRFGAHRGPVEEDVAGVQHGASASSKAPPPRRRRRSPRALPVGRRRGDGGTPHRDRSTVREAQEAEPEREQPEAGPLRRRQAAVAQGISPAEGARALRLAEEVEDEPHRRVGDAHPARVEAERPQRLAVPRHEEGDGQGDGEHDLHEAEIEAPHHAAARHRPAHREPQVREVARVIVHRAAAHPPEDPRQRERAC